MLIINGVIHTMEDGTIPNGFVSIQGGRIAQVGPMAALPGDAGASGVVDAGGGTSCPDSLTSTAIWGCTAAAARRTT